jgi:hypothetical protein
MTPGRKLRTALAVTGIAALLVILAQALQRAASPPAWTADEVERQWGSAPPSTTGSYAFDYGWDATGRYFAIPSRPFYHHWVTIVDRVQRRFCTLALVNWSSGKWIQAAEDTAGYQVALWNQYGLNIHRWLDLTAWQVTVTVSGACPMSPNDCYQVDPPRVSTVACANS